MNKPILSIVILIILSFLLIDSSFSAMKMWKWVDKNGGIHYTDNISNIPTEYRNKAETISISPPPSSQEQSKEYSPPPSPLPMQREKIKKYYPIPGLSLLKEFLNHIGKEVKRDREITKMINNEIAISMMVEWLQRDLPIKKRLLKKLQKTGNINMDDEIEWAFKNMNMEIDILDILLYPNSIFGFMKAQSQIRQAIQEKEKLLDALKDRIRKGKNGR